MGCAFSCFRVRDNERPNNNHNNNNYRLSVSVDPHKIREPVISKNGSNAGTVNQNSHQILAESLCKTASRKLSEATAPDQIEIKKVENSSEGNSTETEAIDRPEFEPATPKAHTDDLTEQVNYLKSVGTILQTPSEIRKSAKTYFQNKDDSDDKIQCHSLFSPPEDENQTKSQPQELPTAHLELLNESNQSPTPQVALIGLKQPYDSENHTQGCLCESPVAETPESGDVQSPDASLDQVSNVENKDSHCVQYFSLHQEDFNEDSKKSSESENHTQDCLYKFSVTDSDTSGHVRNPDTRLEQVSNVEKEDGQNAQCCSLQQEDANGDSQQSSERGKLSQERVKKSPVAETLDCHHLVQNQIDIFETYNVEEEGTGYDKRADVEEENSNRDSKEPSDSEHHYREYIDNVYVEETPKFVHGQRKVGRYDQCSSVEEEESQNDQFSNVKEVYSNTDSLSQDFTHSTSSKQTAETPPLLKSYFSPGITPLRLTDNMITPQTLCSKPINKHVRIRSHYAHHVLNPVENVGQWKEVQKMNQEGDDRQLNYTPRLSTAAIAREEFEFAQIALGSSEHSDSNSRLLMDTPEFITGEETPPSRLPVLVDSSLSSWIQTQTFDLDEVEKPIKVDHHSQTHSSVSFCIHSMPTSKGVEAEKSQNTVEMNLIHDSASSTSDFESLECLSNSLKSNAEVPRNSKPQVSETSNPDDKPILGAMSTSRLNSLSPGNSRKSRSSGDNSDRPIIGMVAAHWNEQKENDAKPKWWDGKGVPNSTHKYKEDQKVSWHSTPFEERLEKALSNEGGFQSKKPTCGKPLSYAETDESDTATSYLSLQSNGENHNILDIHLKKAIWE